YLRDVRAHGRLRLETGERHRGGGLPAGDDAPAADLRRTVPARPHVDEPAAPVRRDPGRTGRPTRPLRRQRAVGPALQLEQQVDATVRPDLRDAPVRAP